MYDIVSYININILLGHRRTRSSQENPSSNANASNTASNETSSDKPPKKKQRTRK